MRRMSVKYCWASIILCVLFVQVFSQDNTYVVDNSEGYGLRFDGIGAISGGGATSKLLVNYPEQQRNEILDYLFKPNYGASLHIFKVELGGDAQSSDGGEASHMHESWDENFQRGYEWWLMTEAKKRNPDILLSALPWAFPAWIGNGTYDAYAIPEVTADYVIRWILGAKTYYNLTIDYIGIWNERNYSTTYIKTLRKALDSRGLQHVRICAPDDLGWQIAGDILKDQELADAVDFIGTHYPKFQSPVEALETGKPLWASEDQDGLCRARMLNRNYVLGKMTATITWNLIMSFYDGLPYPETGMMRATEPWSGNYVVESPIWTNAHTTQFTKPGWQYFRHGSGVGMLAGGGSYVSLTDQNRQELTIVIETMECLTEESSSSRGQYGKGRPSTDSDIVPQNATFTLSGSFANVKMLYVWYTKLDFAGGSSTLFKQLQPIQVTDSRLELTLGVNEVYTLTTVSTGNKGTAPDPPPSQPFPLPYKDNFDEYTPPYEPDNLAQQVGVWEVVEVGPPRGNVIRQVVLKHPVYWCWYGPHPQNNTLNVIGNYNMTDIYLQVDARVGEVNGTDGVYVAARIDRGGCHSSLALGVFFFLFPSQQTYQLTNDLARQKVLDAGHVDVNSDWNTLALLVKGDQAQGMLNGRGLFNVTLPTQPSHGFVGFGTVPYGLADFDNLEIQNSAEGWNRITTAFRN